MRLFISTGDSRFCVFGAIFPTLVTNAEETVLIVDDDEPIRKLAAMIARRAGFDVRVAANGQEAIDLLEEAHFCALLLDLMMPIASGFDVLTWLHENPRPSMHVIVMTAAVESDTISRLRGLPVHLLVKKPFDVEILGTILESCKNLQIPTA
jgi:DNA-binding response OmpR family regulator